MKCDGIPQCEDGSDEFECRTGKYDLSLSHLLAVMPVNPYFYTHGKLCLWRVYYFHVVHPCVSPSVMFCFLNILKRHFWNFIKLCKHIYIYKTNKKISASGQFY